MAGHSHVRGHGHGHGHDPLEVDETRDITWEQETVELATVGIDVGSATTHLTFARVYLQRVGQLLTDRYTVVRRDVRWQSPVELTPYAEGDRIDADAVSAIVRDAYAQAGITPAEVDTGAVLLTGVALLRKNAESLTRELAAFAGDFVCAAASHHMEALLAAHGSGAVAASARTTGTILSLDVGGGTSKYTWLRGGQLVATAAVGVGGRLVVWDETGTVRRLEEYAVRMAAQAGIPLELGAVLEPEQQRALSAAMASLVVSCVTGKPPADNLDLLLTDWPAEASAPASVVLSGGVAEYATGASGNDNVNDLGRCLGTAVGEHLTDAGLDWRVAPLAIRATVLGAAGFSVEVSGNTVFLSDESILPLRDVPVVVASFDVADSVADLERELRSALLGYHGLPGRPVAMFLHLTGAWLSYQHVHGLATAVARVWATAAADFPGPLTLVMQEDLAGSLGRMLRDEFRVTSGLVCLDGIQLSALEFIDIGTARKSVHPVIVKSLIFAAP